MQVLEKKKYFFRFLSERQNLALYEGRIRTPKSNNYSVRYLVSYILSPKWFQKFNVKSSGIFEDDTIISEDSRRSLKSSEEVRRRPKSSEDVRSLPKAKLSSPSLRTRINASSLPVLFTSKIRDREEGIVIYSFYTWFSFLTWV